MPMLDPPCPCWANTRGAAAMAVAAAPVVSMVRLTGSIIGASPDIFLVVIPATSVRPGVTVIGRAHNHGRRGHEGPGRTDPIRGRKTQCNSVKPEKPPG